MYSGWNIVLELSKILQLGKRGQEFMNLAILFLLTVCAFATTSITPSTVNQDNFDRFILFQFNEMVVFTYLFTR